VIEKRGTEEDKDVSTEYNNCLRKTKILIIDDEPDITLLFRKAVMNDGFEDVETANHPRLALKNFKEGSYDLLIIDVVMSQMDGFSLYKEMKKIDNKVKVCFITAFGINYQALRAATTADDIGHPQTS
jgi:DNA-binding NtrC family response regulator